VLAQNDTKALALIVTGLREGRICAVKFSQSVRSGPLNVRHFADPAALFSASPYFFQRFPNGEWLALFSCVGDQEKKNDNQGDRTKQRVDGSEPAPIHSQ